MSTVQPSTPPVAECRRSDRWILTNTKSALRVPLLAKLGVRGRAVHERNRRNSNPRPASERERAEPISRRRVGNVNDLPGARREGVPTVVGTPEEASPDSGTIPGPLRPGRPFVPVLSVSRMGFAC
jgi:hypothetical protein